MAQVLSPLIVAYSSGGPNFWPAKSLASSQLMGEWVRSLSGDSRKPTEVVEARRPLGTLPATQAWKEALPLPLPQARHRSDLAPRENGQEDCAKRVARLERLYSGADTTYHLLLS